MVRSIKYRPLDPSHPNENIKLDGLVQDYSNSIANALELLQCCTKPSVTDDLGFWTTEYEVIADVRVSCIWLPMVHFNCYER